MKLKDWSWDLQRFEEVEYPDELLKGFLDWIRTTKAWRENPYLVGDRLRKLELDLNAYRAAHPRVIVSPTTTTTDQNAVVVTELTGLPMQPSGISSATAALAAASDVPTVADVADRKARQLAALAKAREVRKAKLAAAKGG